MRNGAITSAEKSLGTAGMSARATSGNDLMRLGVHRDHG
jgi:hypothetical protein